MGRVDTGTGATRRHLGGFRGAAIGGALAVGASLIGSAGSLITASAHHIISTTPKPTQGQVGKTALADTALVYADSTRHLVFFLWAPGTCGVSGQKPVLTDSEPVTTPGLADSTVTSATAIPTQVGVYSWTAEIVVNSDKSVEYGPTACTDEQVTVNKIATQLSTTPSNATGAPVGTKITDSAIVTGGFNPTGTVTFSVFGPNNPSCSSDGASPLQQWTVALGDGGSASVPAPGLTTASTGTYNWVADYSGDADNMPSHGACGLESVSVSKASPAIVTAASAGGPVGTQIHDTAQVSGGVNPTGTVTFSLFAPDNPTCSGTDSSGAVQTVVAPLGADGSATSAGTPYTTTEVGTYRWIAVYSGDANNNAASTLCSDEPVSIGQDATSVTTIASAGGATGTGISDTATVKGGANPTGTVTFKLYGPNDTTCSGAALFTSTVALRADGTATSGTFNATTIAGTYNWTAAYSGDTNNSGAHGACGSEPVSITAPISSGVQGVSTPETGAGSPLGAGIGLLLGGLGMSLVAELVRGRRRSE